MGQDIDALATGFMTSQMLQVLGKLGIVELLKEGPADVSELARATGCHPPSLTRLLRALTALDVLAEERPGCFRLTREGARLRRDHPDSLAPVVRDSGAPHVQAAWLELAHAVRTGRSAFEYAHGIDYWTYLARHSDLPANRSGTAAMEPATRARMLAAACDFSSVRTLVNVGDGSALLLAAILERNPAMRGIFFDEPWSCSAATALLRERGLEERVRVVVGDLFSELPPGADVYLLATAISDRSDEDSLRILRGCRRAAAPGSRLLVIEVLGPPPPLADVERMVLFGEARERTEEGLRNLVGAAGFGSPRIVATGSGTRILEALPAWSELLQEQDEVIAPA